jgi:hypothetical protein
LIRDRLIWLRFPGFDLCAPTPDANTIRLYRERLTKAKAITVAVHGWLGWRAGVTSRNFSLVHLSQRHPSLQ